MGKAEAIAALDEAFLQRIRATTPPPASIPEVLLRVCADLDTLSLTFAEPRFLHLEIGDSFSKHYPKPPRGNAMMTLRSILARFCFAINDEREQQLGFSLSKDDELHISPRTPEEAHDFVLRHMAGFSSRLHELRKRGHEPLGAYGFRTTLIRTDSSGRKKVVHIETNNNNTVRSYYLRITVSDLGAA